MSLAVLAIRQWGFRARHRRDVLTPKSFQPLVLHSAVVTFGISVVDVDMAAVEISGISSR